MTLRVHCGAALAALCLAAPGWAQDQAPQPAPRGFLPEAPPVAGPRGDRGINDRGLGGGAGPNGIVGAPATNGSIDRNPAHRRARQAAAAEAAASAVPLPEECRDGSALLARSPTGDIIDCPRPGEGARPIEQLRSDD